MIISIDLQGVVSRWRYHEVTTSYLPRTEVANEGLGWDLPSECFKYPGGDYYQSIDICLVCSAKVVSGTF